jgi:hypothetical protein
MISPPLRSSIQQNVKSIFTQETKHSLKAEVVSVRGFPTKYSFMVQAVLHGFHWNNQQATIHSFVYYLKNPNSVRKLLHFC